MIESRIYNRDYAYNRNADKAGIYKLIEVTTQKVYIGSTGTLNYRRRGHFSLLRCNKHRNPYLQNYFNKYGESNFKWEVLEYLPRDSKILAEREEYWIACFRANEHDYGFNIRNVCESNLGVPGTGKISRGEKNARAVEYCLLDITTNEIYEGKCVAEFCRQQNIRSPESYFFMVSGKTNIWCNQFVLPERINKIKRYVFINDKGEIWETYNLKEFCIKYDLSYDMIFKVSRKKRKEYEGWMLYSE